MTAPLGSRRILWLVGGLALLLIGCFWMSGPRVTPFDSSDAVGELLRDPDVLLALWADDPRAAIRALTQTLELDPERLADSFGFSEEVESRAATLRWLAPRGAALRLDLDGGASLRMRPIRVASLGMRLWGWMRRDPWLQGGIVPVEDADVSVQWLPQGVWSLRLDRLSPSTESGGRRSEASRSTPADDAEWRRLLSADLDDVTLVMRVDSARLSGLGSLDGRIEGVGASRSARQASLHFVGVSHGGEDQPRVLRIEPIERASASIPSDLGGRQWQSAFDEFRGGDVLLAAAAGGPQQRALLMLRQERRPRTTQVPSAAVLAWGDSDFWSLPARRLHGILDIRHYDHDSWDSPSESSSQVTGATASSGAETEVPRGTQVGRKQRCRIRAYDRASLAAARAWEPLLRPRAEARNSELMLWTRADAMAVWLDDYVDTLEELRLVEATQRRRWRTVERFLAAFPAGKAVAIRGTNGALELSLFDLSPLTVLPRGA